MNRTYFRGVPVSFHHKESELTSLVNSDHQPEAVILEPMSVVVPVIEPPPVPEVVHDELPLTEQSVASDVMSDVQIDESETSDTQTIDEQSKTEKPKSKFSLKKGKNQKN